MKKLLLGSAALTLFSISILIFQVSCKKDAKAQSGTNSCSEIATVIITVNFPLGFNPLNSTNLDNENGIVLKSSTTGNADNYTLINYGFRNVGSIKQKTYTFKTTITGLFTYDAMVRKSTSPMDFLETYGSINLVAGQTNNITINASDFH